jgi:putative redox protein
MSSKTTLKWMGDMSFDAEVSGHHIILDADSEWGGKDQGPRPQPLLLASLSGCSGMDVISILEKMRVKDYQFKVEVDADSTTDHPVYYHTIRMSFYFQGEGLPPDKILKAVELSTQRYCGVYEMLRQSANIIVKTYINGKEVLA